MSKYFVFVLAVAGLMVAAGTSSVRAEGATWGTDNAQLESQDTSAPLMFAKAVKKKSVSADTPAEAKVSVGSGFFAGLYAGYDYAGYGALGSDINGLSTYAKSLGDNNTLGVGNSGLLVGAKIGYNLDASNSLDVSCEYTGTSESGLNITSGPDTGYYEKFGPTLLGVSLNYELAVLKGNGSKTCLVVGGGFYHGAVHMDSNLSGTTIVGDFGQDNIGGTLGLDEQMSMGGGLSLNISAKFRAADFGKLTANSVVANGATQTSGGPFVLVSVPNSGYNEEDPVPTSTTLPPGIKDTDMDYTGFTGNVELQLSL